MGSSRKKGRDGGGLLAENREKVLVREKVTKADFLLEERKWKEAQWSRIKSHERREKMV